MTCMPCAPFAPTPTTWKPFPPRWEGSYPSSFVISAATGAVVPSFRIGGLAKWQGDGHIDYRPAFRQARDSSLYRCGARRCACGWGIRRVQAQQAMKRVGNKCVCFVPHPCFGGMPWSAVVSCVILCAGCANAALTFALRQADDSPERLFVRDDAYPPGPLEQSLAAPSARFRATFQPPGGRSTRSCCLTAGPPTRRPCIGLFRVSAKLFVFF